MNWYKKAQSKRKIPTGWVSLGPETIDGEPCEEYYSEYDDTETMGGLSCETRYLVFRNEAGEITDILEKFWTEEGGEDDASFGPYDGVDSYVR